MREGVDDPEKLALIDDVSANNIGLFEFCSFQDITGQRVTKVVRSLTCVKDTVNALIDAGRKAQLEDVEVEGMDKSEDEKLLNGLQHEGEGISQAEIDALFDEPPFPGLISGPSVFQSPEIPALTSVAVGMPRSGNRAVTI